MSTKRRIKYREGDWISIPLAPRHFGLGRIARAREGFLVCYLFRVTFESTPGLADVPRFRPGEALTVIRVGDLGFSAGEWVSIRCDRDAWARERSEWPIPAFGTILPILDMPVRREYDPDDPSDMRPRETRISHEECERLPPDGLFGHVALEIRFARLLGLDVQKASEEGETSTMGTWGTGIFDDDVAVDVRGEYEEARETGLSPEAAARQVLETWGDQLDDMDDGPIVWIALAATQLEEGAILDDVRRNAIAAIDAGADMPRWLDSATEAHIAEHQATLADLRAQFVAADPSTRTEA